MDLLRVVVSATGLGVACAAILLIADGDAAAKCVGGFLFAVGLHAWHDVRRH